MYLDFERIDVMICCEDLEATSLLANKAAIYIVLFVGLEFANVSAVDVSGSSTRRSSL